MIKIAPSILAADPLNLERDVRIAVESGCDWIHVDIMDAHFVPNLGFTPATVRRLKETFDVFLDVHLMMDHPETMTETFAKAGADNITIHAEVRDAAEILKQIQGFGISAGVALKPGTPAETVYEYMENTDLILAMTVEPGFGGQSLDERVIDKIRKLRDTGYKGEIEADGGIREDNLPKLKEAGLSVAVMGTALFRCTDMKAAIERMHGFC